MKKIINWVIYNKGLILFYIIFMISIIAWCNYVEKTNDTITNIKNNQVERWSR